MNEGWSGFWKFYRDDGARGMELKIQKLWEWGWRDVYNVATVWEYF